MKTPLMNHILPVAGALTISLAQPLLSAITVDGTLDAPDYGPPLCIQTTPTNWGPNNHLSNLHAVRNTADTIHVFVGGRASAGNAIILFIDSKAGGNSFVPNDAILSGGEEGYINNLGSSPTAGLTFESGFAPDFAIRIYGNGTNAFGNLYNFAARTRIFLGNSGTGSAAGGAVTSMRTAWEDLAELPADHTSGVELSLNMHSLGIPTGNQVVKFMAIMVNDGSIYGSNQVLASRTSTTVDIGDGTNGTIGLPNANFETEQDFQTVGFWIDGSDTDGDGIQNWDDPDDDNDSIPDTAETNTGVFVDSTNTGTDPLRPDTDGDGLSDWAEIHTHGTNPTLADTDLDGLSDRAEIEVHFCNPLVKDSDSDGFEDLFEVNTGFNPSLNTSTPDALSSIRTAVEFRFNAASGISYRIESSTDLDQWSTTETDIIGAGAAITRFYSIENQPKRYFRARRN